MVKNLPTVQETKETWVRSSGWEDPLEKGMATHSSILAWRTPQTEEPGGLQSVGLHKSDTTERLSTLYTTSLKDSSQQFQKPSYSVGGIVVSIAAFQKPGCWI